MSPSTLQVETSRLLWRPLYGGAFGAGRYALASMPCVALGLHAVKFLVIEPHCGSVLSVANDKVEAISQARQMLLAANDVSLARRSLKVEQQANLWADDELPIGGSPAHNVSRRRREIFERSQGKCHYCATPLQLDGKWHVEHMLPRALGGADDKLNLVVACVRCNLQKRDRTALEFVVG